MLYFPAKGRGEGRVLRQSWDTPLICYGDLIAGNLRSDEEVQQPRATPFGRSAMGGNGMYQVQQLPTIRRERPFFPKEGSILVIDYLA